MITICTNTETVAQSLEGPGVSASVARAAAEMWTAREAGDVAFAAGIRHYETSSRFTDWHGGRAWQTVGSLVAFGEQQ